jgi:hypothetical protein
MFLCRYFLLLTSYEGPAPAPLSISLSLYLSISLCVVGTLTRPLGVQLLPSYVQYEIRFRADQRPRLMGRIMEGLGRHAQVKQAKSVECRLVAHE